MSAEESGQAKRLKVDVESTTESTEPGSSPVIISEALAKFLGTVEREMLQSEALRLVWEYIKVNHLEVGSIAHKFPLLCLSLSLSRSSKFTA
jgi:chromatin remodeling complex protein RSC6